MIKPVLFNTEMVCALLDDRKTETRRIAKPQPELFYTHGETRDLAENDLLAFKIMEHSGKDCLMLPPCQPGDILYVRETWTYLGTDQENNPCFAYKAKSPHLQGNMYIKWRPSIHMPKEAARIFLRVTDVRAERLQDITIDGVEHEGIPLTFPTTKMIESEHLKKFITVWNSTIKKSDIDRYSWQSNPWVWVIEFERISKEDAYNA